MDAASTHPAAVLDYAAPKPPDSILRGLRALAAIPFCMLLCGGAGYLFQPDVYRSAAIMQVNSPVGIAPTVDVMAGVIPGLTSPANLNAASANLRAQGISVAASGIAKRVTVKRIPDSQLIYVAFDAARAADATAGVNTVVSSYATSGVSVVRVVAPAGVSTRSQRNVVYPLAGAAVGLLAGLFIVAGRSK